jgi:DNA-directed RNA polymerase subunit RPC12/RpoP
MGLRRGVKGSTGDSFISMVVVLRDAYARGSGRMGARREYRGMEEENVVYPVYPAQEGGMWLAGEDSFEDGETAISMQMKQQSACRVCAFRIFMRSRNVRWYRHRRQARHLRLNR